MGRPPALVFSWEHTVLTFHSPEKERGGVWGADGSVSKPLHSVIHRDVELTGQAGAGLGQEEGPTLRVLAFLR